MKTFVGFFMTVLRVILLLSGSLMAQALSHENNIQAYDHQQELDGSSRILEFRGITSEKATSGLTTEEDSWTDGKKGGSQGKKGGSQGKKGGYQGKKGGYQGKKGGYQGKKGGYQGKKGGYQGKKGGYQGKKGGGGDDDDGPTVSTPRPTPGGPSKPVPMPTGPSKPVPVPATPAPTQRPTPEAIFCESTAECYFENSPFECAVCNQNSCEATCTGFNGCCAILNDDSVQCIIDATGASADCAGDDVIGCISLMGGCDAVGGPSVCDPMDFVCINAIFAA